MNEIDITDAVDPRLGPYRNVRDAHLRAEREVAPGGLSMAEGEVVVRTLIDSPYPVHSVLTTRARLATVGDALERLGPETPVYLVTQELMDEVTGFHIHRALLAAGSRAHVTQPDELVDATGPLVVLEDLANHDNVGGAFRNAAAFGAGGVLLSPGCADPLYRKALRVSVGHALTTPFARTDDLPGTLEALKSAGWTLVALANTPEAEPIGTLSRRLDADRVALVLGAEGPGLTDRTLQIATEAAKIPIRAGVDSLNAATALGIALFNLVQE